MRFAANLRFLPRDIEYLQAILPPSCEVRHQAFSEVFLTGVKPPKEPMRDEGSASELVSWAEQPAMCCPGGSWALTCLGHALPASFLVCPLQEEFFQYLATLDCSAVRIFSIPEGSVCFPRVPMMRIEGPLLVWHSVCLAVFTA